MVFFVDIGENAKACRFQGHRYACHDLIKTDLYLHIETVHNASCGLVGES